jgi:hypothetical protein
VAANNGCGSGSASTGGRVWARTRGAPRRPRKWLTFSTGNQSSKPSFQQCRSSSLARAATQAWASVSVNGPSWLPSLETYHSSSSAAGGGAAGIAGGAGIVGAGERVGSAPPSSMPSRTVITAEQFLQRILRILPRTRSSAIA